MKIRWSPEAADDLERIAQHIMKSNPQAAQRIAKAIYNGITTLKRFPNRGRAGRMCRLTKLGSTGVALGIE